MNVYCYDIAKYEKKKTLYDKVTNKINKINRKFWSQHDASQLPSGRAPFTGCKRPALTLLPIFLALTPPLCFPVILPASIVIHLMCLRLLITHRFR